ncbi:MAG: RNA polymerase factor sigma-54 [Bacteroidota bacterium]|jgi:RNA polymerase sigma-54 factor
MHIKNYQNQKQGTNQKHGYYMSQQHLKLMHLMHLTGYALKEYIKNEIEFNPALEIENEYLPDENTSEENEDEGDYNSDLFWNKDDDLFERSVKSQKTNTEYFEAPVISFRTLQENLKDQISLMNIEDEIKEISFFVIDELDDDGYLRRKTDEVADDYGFQQKKYISENKIIKALEFIQLCEPAGVGARDLQECLLIQLKKIKFSETKILSEKIIKDYFNALTINQYEKISSELNIDKSKLEEAIQFIIKLNPKPVYESNKYEQLLHQIIPDFEVHVEDNELYVSMINSDYIKLKVNEEYLKLNNESSSKKGKNQAENHLQNMLTEAILLVNALKDRENTMIRVMHTIVQMQKDFFKSGDIKDLKPMILQDVAESTNYDISAVSRITSNKYVQTPFGIFSLKQLFMRAVSGEEVGMRATTSIQVQELIQKIVQTEDKARPLSDTEIMKILKDKNINIARRTIVKYREISGIPNSATRKKQQVFLN